MCGCACGCACVPMRVCNSCVTARVQEYFKLMFDQDKE